MNQALQVILLLPIFMVILAFLLLIYALSSYDRILTWKFSSQQLEDI
jgi:hypothetical protein